MPTPRLKEDFKDYPVCMGQIYSLISKELLAPSGEDERLHSDIVNMHIKNGR